MIHNDMGNGPHLCNASNKWSLGRPGKPGSVKIFVNCPLYLADFSSSSIDDIEWRAGSACGSKLFFIITCVSYINTELLDWGC